MHRFLLLALLVVSPLSGFASGQSACRWDSDCSWPARCGHDKRCRGPQPRPASGEPRNENHNGWDSPDAPHDQRAQQHLNSLSNQVSTDYLNMNH